MWSVEFDGSWNLYWLCFVHALCITKSIIFTLGITLKCLYTSGPVEGYSYLLCNPCKQ